MNTHFKDFLEALGFNPKDYLNEARSYAHKGGYDPTKLGFNTDNKSNAKLIYEGVGFGRIGYKDYLIWRHLEKTDEVARGTAEKRKSAYLARATKIRGNWRQNPLSRNSLVITILWNGKATAEGGGSYKKIHNPFVVVKKSPIEGLGVFAKIDIPDGTKIAEYYGKEMSWKDFTKKYGPYKDNSQLTYPMRRIWRIIVAKEEPYKSGNLTSYVNEKIGGANAVLKNRALYADKNIKKGEELLLEYPKDYNRFWLKAEGGKLTPAKIAIAKTYKDYSVDDIMKDYEWLKSMPCNDPLLPRSRAGLKVVDDATFAARMDTFSKGYSLYTFLNKLPQLLKPTSSYPSIRRLLDYYKTSGRFTNMRDFALNTRRLYFGSIAAFKPATAKWIYCKLGAKNILDFSAGWGGRLVGAMVIPNTTYIGIDTNKDLKSGYDKMIKELGVGDRARMIYQDSAKVDYSKLNYDFVLTSPPYFTLEKYEGMPIYKTREDFDEKFYKPVLSKVWAGLKKGGTMALNIPHEGTGGDMLTVAEEVIGKHHSKMALPIARPRKDKKEGYTEYIYIWRK